MLYVSFMLSLEKKVLFAINIFNAHGISAQRLRKYSGSMASLLDQVNKDPVTSCRSCRRWVGNWQSVCAPRLQLSRSSTRRIRVHRSAQRVYRRQVQR